MQTIMPGRLRGREHKAAGSTITQALAPSMSATAQARAPEAAQMRLRRFLGLSERLARQFSQVLLEFGNSTETAIIYYPCLELCRPSGMMIKVGHCR